MKTNIKTIPNFPNYAISKDGDVWSDLSFKFLKPYLNRKYFMVNLFRNRKRYNFYVHHLVLETFVELRPPGMECRHLDGNPANNRLENLRWGTHKENGQDSIRHKTHIGKRVNIGSQHGMAKLTEQDVRMIVYMWRIKLFKQWEIAEIYKIGQDEVSRIVNKKSWKHIWKEIK